MNDAHRDTEVMRIGAELREARAAVVMLHGRGASAEDILGLAREMYHDEIAYLAPQAAGHTWYPNSFLAPIGENEPWLSSALKKVSSVVGECQLSGVPRERVIILGFSQGACLATEFVARNPSLYGGLIAFTGGLLGPPGSDLKHRGFLKGMPALFSSGDPDPHVPWTRVEESAKEFKRMGAEVRLVRHPSRPHTILPSEVELADALLARLSL
jgi:phospholipase/carboxylesterase